MALDDRYALAAIAAETLATILQSAAGRLPLTAAQGQTVKRGVFAVSVVMAPAITTPADVAAIGGVLSTAAAALLPPINIPTTIAPRTGAATMTAGAASMTITPRDAAGVFYDAAASCAVAAPTFASVARTAQAALSRRLAECCEASWLGQAFVCEAQSNYSDRQAAIAARGRIGDAMDAAIDRIAAATSGAIVGLLGNIARTASDHIATVAADLRPIVRVGSARSAPSTAVAFELYGDPSRAPELVARTKVATPLFMPVSLDALAPNS